MPLTLVDGKVRHWEVRKIGVIGPGIVGMPMAAMLAHARIAEGGASPARVTVVQRDSTTSGWKVGAINEGRSPIGGVEPGLDDIVASAVADGLLAATHDYAELQDADVVLVCVQTDKRGTVPDYGPLFEALDRLTEALRHRPEGNIPLVVFESTLAPSTMATMVREHFADRGLVDGRDVLLGNSPNRVMPGRLVERVTTSDKLAAGLQPVTAELIQRLYRRIVTRATVHRTNSMTAEVVKTLENAYRDVRIAFTNEVARHCDRRGIDFYRVRERVNDAVAQRDDSSHDPTAVPTGGLLIPTLGVGGHCLPKDGILLWWRLLEAGMETDSSLILEARRINDESPGDVLRQAEATFGALRGRTVALLGAAYRFNSEDTRNSPTLVLAGLLEHQGAHVTIHDPHVYPSDQNLERAGLTDDFTRDLPAALEAAEFVFVCTAHDEYRDRRPEIAAAPRLVGLVDACNLYSRTDFPDSVAYVGIGRGTTEPDAGFVAEVARAFRNMELGVANELATVIEFLNEHYAGDRFTTVEFAEVQRLAGTCVTGCDIADPREVTSSRNGGFESRLVDRARARAASA